MSVTRIPVVLLEPDQWRYQGMATILNESGDAEVIGTPDYAQLLTAEQPPDGLHPRVCIVAHRLIVEYGLAVIPQLKEIFPDCAVLVHGEADSVEAEAQVMAVGASGLNIRQAMQYKVVSSALTNTTTSMTYTPSNWNGNIFAAFK